MNPKPRALRYSVLSFDRIGRWLRACKMLGLGPGARVRVSDPAMRTDMPRSPAGDQQGRAGLEPVTPRCSSSIDIVQNPGGLKGPSEGIWGSKGPLECSSINIVQNPGGLKGPSGGFLGVSKAPRVQLRCGCARAPAAPPVAVARLPCRLRSQVLGALPRHLPMPFPPGWRRGL